MSETIQSALTAVELREAELLSWGAVGAEWTHDELVRVLADHGAPEILLAQMLEKALIVQTPSGGYRSRSAETVRTLATLRQAFRQEAMLQGRPLVLDYRFLQRPRRRPRRDVPSRELIANVAGLLGPHGQAALRSLAPPTASAFQVRSTRAILEAVGSTEAAGVVVTAGTGSGKTLAFYMPMIAWICDHAKTMNEQVLALALYPRNELLKDQLRTLVAYALRLRRAPSEAAPLSLATWFGPTPQSAFGLRKGWAQDWRETGQGYICPFLRCPEDDCASELIWPHDELRAGTELLRCISPTCSVEVPGDILRLTRESARSHPARIMLSTTESLNRQLSAPGNLRAFGIGDQGLKAVLLDEVHIYEGTTGAQNAYLFRRLRKALGHDPLWAGLSATLANADTFFGRLVDLNAGRVNVVEPDPDELEESGAEYLVALRHNPYGSTGTLSTTIQTAMALSRALDPMTGNPFNPPIDSDGIFGSRVFAFTDKLDSTNRLYWDLLDAEGWAWPNTANQGQTPLTLAHLRSGEQERVAVARREDREQRDANGQHWWLAEDLGHEIDGDVQKRVGRTSSQDSGVAHDADIIVATASLEVGFDDDRVGAVLQHKAPHDVAQFLQRKGRAGRNAATRPWTVVVLSDWGRDRQAWDAYDALFSPVVPPRTLPLENLYVLRIQAVYSLLDWLAHELNYGLGSSWADAAGPADLLAENAAAQSAHQVRQQQMAGVLSAVLRDGTERASLRRHLRRGLALGTGPAADVTLDKLLWEVPRPLLATVVPTLRRRLNDQWNGERPAPDDASVRSRTPLRDFVPGNLFDDLLVPDVEFQVPWARNEMRVEHLSALRAIREFLPGNVSRHFGVRATNKRHWVPLPVGRDDDGARIIDIAGYGPVLIDEIPTERGPIRLFAPTLVTLQPVPAEVSDASSMHADWVFIAAPLGRGTGLPLVGGVSDIFEQLTAHMHSQGGGARILRYASSASGTAWTRGQSNPERIHFYIRRGEDWEPTALGVEIHADALHGRVVLPQFDRPPTRVERVDWLRELIATQGDFPDDLSTFDRHALADAVEAVAVSWSWGRGDPGRAEFGQALRDAAVLLGLADPLNPGTLSSWLADGDVLAHLHDALLGSRAPIRNQPWIEWLERRYTLSAAETLLAALTSGDGRVDVDDLTIDLDPRDVGAFYISEQSPGGTGQVEALAGDLIDRPERLPMALADVMRPTDLELMDEQLRAVIDSPESTVKESVEQLATSWRSGHESVRHATARLDRVLETAGLTLQHPAKTALSTRLAGPGASPQLLDEVKTWLSVRDDAEHASGMAVEPRTLAALVASRSQVDPFLHLDRPTEARRSRAIANVLWPWGRAVAPAGSFNPYSGQLKPSIDLLRQYWRSPVFVLEISTWNDALRAELHRLLVESSEVVVRVPATMRPVLRSAVIDVQTTPVEVGPLLCYPQVLGVLEHGMHAEARFLLRETW
jgi:hypothetical protein